MQNDDSTPKTGESTSTDGDRRSVMNRAANATSPVKMSRRGMMRMTAGAGVAALGLGAGVTGSVSAGAIADFDNLTVDAATNTIVNESDETFKMRGVSIPDPRRLHRTRHLRGKTPVQLVDMMTNNEEGWYPRAIRVPAQPQDIGTRDDGSHHPMGHAGPEYEPGELESPEAVADDRRKMQPSQPVAFTRNELESYLENYYDPIVQRCKERGVYCIVDYHRHWHEQPPGAEGPSYAENHLPYDSEYTNYWAYNTFQGSNVSFGTDTPGSWGYVDQTYINEGNHSGEQGVWAGVESEADIPGTPYAYENWQVNEELLEEALLFWEVVADRYADEPHVLFEPYNEPTSPGIWGPTQGCGAIKQIPLWETFLYDFMGPILDEIRQHQPERALLVGVPGWCQSVQALHWENFNEAGWDNIAVTWHNYAGHDVSQINNWFNNTNYRHYSEIEPETDGELTDPFLPPKESLDDGETPDCWGWEGYEAAGLQNAMDHHPVAISEFGWINDPAVSHWLRGTTTGQGTLPEYGIPFLDQVEDDPRISWIGWCADVRWLPKMFDVTWEVDEGELDLVNDNFYDTPFEQIPVGCEELPCEWELLGGEDSGEYLKQMLDENQDDLVPFETETIGAPTPGDVIEINGYDARDTTDDGLYNDINGDGETTHEDVTAFFQHLDGDGVQNNADSFDFAGDGDAGFSDVISLFEQM